MKPTFLIAKVNKLTFVPMHFKDTAHKNIVWWRSGWSSSHHDPINKKGLSVCYIGVYRKKQRRKS